MPNITLTFTNDINVSAQVGDTIYSGSSSSSSTVTWTDYKGFNPADVGGGSESSGTVNAAGVIQLIAICP